MISRSAEKEQRWRLVRVRNHSCVIRVVHNAEMVSFTSKLQNLTVKRG